MATPKDYERLIGRRIGWVSLINEGTTLKLETVDKLPGEPSVFHLDAVGDCCSTSWFESADAIENLTRATITSVENIDMPNLGSKATLHHTSVDCVAYYGLKFTTDKGICVIDYRNDSNGYYGGWVTLREK